MPVQMTPAKEAAIREFLRQTEEKNNAKAVDAKRAALEARYDAEAEAEANAVRRTSPWRKTRQHAKNEPKETPTAGFSLAQLLHVGD